MSDLTVYRERPLCEEDGGCDRTADLAVRDHARGWGNPRNPHRRICQHHYEALMARVDPDDPWAPSYPVIERYQEDTMPTTDTAALSDQLTPLAAEYAQLAEQAEQVKARQEAIKAQIRELVPGPDSYDAGALSVVVSTNRRFDAKRALAMLPEALVPLVTYPETTIDKEKLKVLARDVYDAAQVDYAERVTIK